MALKSKEWDDHKYVARVPLKTSGKKKKYRYFYTKAAYQAYLKGSKKQQDAKAQDKKIVQDVKLTKAKSNVKKAANNLTNVKPNIVNSTPTKTASVDKVKNIIKQNANKSTKEVAGPIDTGKKFVATIANKTIAAVTTVIGAVQNKVEDHKENKAEIEKDKNPQSFADLDRLKTDMDDNLDQAYINPDYSPFKYGTSMNCAFCTAAYDLRQRGYDVEAKDIDRSTLNTIDTIESWYEGGESTAFTDIVERRAVQDGYYDDYRITNEECAEMIEKDLLEQGDGARGHFVVYWSSGGGHDVIYEVENGEVRIRDCQNNQIYKVEDYMPYIADMCYMRTDNLEPSEAILDTVENRKKGR